MKRSTRNTRTRKTRGKYAVDRPYCGGQWTKARTKTFIMSQLRLGLRKWSPYLTYKHSIECKRMTNKETGRMAKHYKCESCGDMTVKHNIDHIIPVVPTNGFEESPNHFLGVDWNVVVANMFCEQEDDRGKRFQLLCKACHGVKSKLENAERRKNK